MRVHIKAIDTVADSRIEGGILHAKKKGIASKDAAQELEDRGFVRILGPVKESKEKEALVGNNVSVNVRRVGKKEETITEDTAKKERLKAEAKQKAVPENKMISRKNISNKSVKPRKSSGGKPGRKSKEKPLA